MSKVKHLDLVQPYLGSVDLERRILHDVLAAEGMDPRKPLVSNGVSMSNVGSRRTYRLGTKVLVRFHFENYLIVAVEIPGRPMSRLAWAG